MKQLLPIGILLAGPSLGQAPETLLSPGDTLPNGATVRIIWEAEISAGGEWIARLDIDMPNGDVEAAALTSEGQFMASGGPVPGMSGSTIRNISRVARDDLGNTYCDMNVRLPDGSSQNLLHKGFSQPLLKDDDIINGLMVPEISDIDVNGQGQVMIVGRISDPNHSPPVYRAIATLQQSAGVVTGVNVLVDGSLNPPGQSVPVNTFSTIFDACKLGDSGDIAWTASLATSPPRTAAYTQAGALLLEGGAPSPIPGRSWPETTVPSFDINASGSLLMAADLDGSILDDEVYLRDGVVVRREADPVPGQTGLTFRILDRIVNLTDSGELIHWAVLSGLPNSSNNVVMKGDQILVREGVTTTTAGSLIVNITSTTKATADGRWILFRGWHSGDNSARLMRVEAKPIIGAPYCSVELNSTGVGATTCAYGSDVVADANVRLSCTDMPLNTFGYFLASRTQGDVLFPGGSQGRLCLGGSIARFVSLAQNSGPGGQMDVEIDLSSIPVSPPTAVAAGDTWSFQGWFRDFGIPPTSNFSLPVAVTFQ